MNDVAVAVAAVREQGFSGRVAVLDLDAHPPDGIAACLARDPKHWIGSILGPTGVRSRTWTRRSCPRGPATRSTAGALAALLGRMPRPQLAFVLAGGDVLARDRFGKLGLTLEGARARSPRRDGASRGSRRVCRPPAATPATRGAC